MAAENKTQPTEKSVIDFLNSVENDQRRDDSFEVLKLMEKITGEPAKMWGAINCWFWILPLQICHRP